MNQFKYCESLTEYRRYKTREVKIGDLPLGGNNPVRIQSMTTTNTLDTIATVEQSIRMFEAGSEYVRITAPSINEAKNLQNIKNELRNRGYNIPLIADIHFTPNAAEMAARIVEKVRINPGNYADKKKFQQIEYTDSEYAEEIERIRERFTPLIKVCKEYGTAMRIGTNHGSLSDRIMSRYGDTPLGMVESALEFVRICEENNYHDIVLSMKASNPQVMVQAYRLLVNKMTAEGMNYPLHLGVTEAGDGEDARIKSAAGIGTLLEDGLGDTIRVSLTEEPEAEPPVAFELANRFSKRENTKKIYPVNNYIKNPFEFEKCHTIDVAGIGTGNEFKVLADFSHVGIKEHNDFKDVGYSYNSETDKWNLSDFACDLIYLGDNILSFDAPQNLKIIYNYSTWLKLESKLKGFPLFSFNEFKIADSKSFVLNFVMLTIEDIFTKDFSLIDFTNTVFVLRSDNTFAMAEMRRAFFKLLELGINIPVIIKREYNNIDTDKLRLYSATDIGALLIDGFGDGVWMEYRNSSLEDLEFINRTLFGILQAARVRISKTEYIACPSCGRTLFDLVEVTDKIRKRTSHLKGVKIGIMGCIVNGPGEMADADYGYVGSGVDKITLYKGKEVVMKSVNSSEAVERLIDIIKEDGNWIEPKIN